MALNGGDYGEPEIQSDGSIIYPQDQEYDVERGVEHLEKMKAEKVKLPNGKFGIKIPASTSGHTIGGAKRTVDANWKHGDDRKKSKPSKRPGYWGAPI